MRIEHLAMYVNDLCAAVGMSYLFSIPQTVRTGSLSVSFRLRCRIR